MFTTSATTLQLPLLLVFCLFSIQGAHGLQCYSCKDIGDGGCSANNTVPCPYPYDVCVQTLTSVNISFTSLMVLTKGCGSNASSQSPIQRNREAIATVTEIEVCNTDLCNTRQFEAAMFPLANRTVNTSTVSTSVDCYGCIGITEDQCSDRRASSLSCAGYACAEGSLEIQLRNEKFLTVFFKDCGRWGSFYELQANARLWFVFRRTVCTGALCNKEPVPITTTPKGGSNVLTSSHLLLALVLAALLS